MNLTHIKADVENIGGTVTEHRDPEATRNGVCDLYLLVTFPSMSVSSQVDDYLHSKSADCSSLGWYWDSNGAVEIYWEV